MNQLAIDLERIDVWGLPLVAATLDEAADAVMSLAVADRPSFVITANAHYTMLTHEMSRLREINERAALILADGFPLVWASKILGSPLPERVAGSDLIFSVCERAARTGHRLFLLGGADGVAEEAARNLIARFPGLNVVGVECPPFRPLSDDEDRRLVERIRSASPDLLIVAFTMPRGEMWVAERLADLAVPVTMCLGASIDFAAGRVRRAPRGLQWAHLEWAFRLWLEPRRMFPRYYRNARFLLPMFARTIHAELGSSVRRVGRRGAITPPIPPTAGVAELGLHD